MQQKTRTLLGCAVTTLVTIGYLALPTRATASLTLAENGQTTYTIALADDAVPAEQTAAAELEKYLEEVTGASFSVAPEGQVLATTPQILVGAGTRARMLLPSQQWNDLGPDGIVVKSVGQNLILAGGRPRGSLYAVYQFLESSVGCRWWTPQDSKIPQRPTLTVGTQDVTYVPPFDYREHYTTSVRNDPVFATKMRENGHHQTQSASWGGHHSILGFVHTFSELLPPSEYFAEHPEWYSDPDNGYLPCTATSRMPNAQATELCLTNPDVQDELTLKALAWIAANPDAGYISISHNDNTNSYCRDAAAMTLINAEGSPSAPLIQFVNIIAGRIKQQYPNFMVETLAYHWSEKPPSTIQPADNVIVRLAPIRADFGHPMGSVWNAATRNNIEAWSAISSQLFIWNYVTNFRATMLPHPNWDGLAKDLRFFEDNKVTGVFEQGDAYTNGVGDFVQLRAWLMGKLMWDPSLNQSALMNEFMQNYYGDAEPYLRQYIDLLQSSYLAQNRPLLAYNQDMSFFTLDVMNQSMQLFDSAEQAVSGNADQLYRVKRERLSLELARLYQFNMLMREALRDNKPLLGDNDPIRAMQQFIEDARAFGVLHFSEGNLFENHVPALNSMFSTAVELPEFAKQHPAYDVISIQPGTFYLYGKGSLSFLEPDPEDPGNTVASITGGINDWAIQVLLSQNLTSTSQDKWRIYAMMRADVTPGQSTQGKTFQSGVYDDVNGQYINTVNVPLDRVQGDTYKAIDLGAHELNGNMFIWFTPGQNSPIEKLYVDSIILIREPFDMPDFTDQYPSYDVIGIQPNTFYLYGKGTHSFLDPDPQEPTNIVASVNGGINAWAIQSMLNKTLVATSQGHWRIYAMMRADITPGQSTQGKTFQSGVYDDVNSQYINTVNVPLDQVQGNTYKAIDLGAFNLNGNMLIWFTPGQNTPVEKLYVDSIILVREPP
jgi:hypothetical protein